MRSFGEHQNNELKLFKCDEDIFDYDPKHGANEESTRRFYPLQDSFQEYKPLLKNRLYCLPKEDLLIKGNEDTISGTQL